MNAIALVVGNSNYVFDAPSFVLKNPGNDARGVADALTRLGFFLTLSLFRHFSKNRPFVLLWGMLSG